jgi:hypothetical protein
MPALVRSVLFLLGTLASLGLAPGCASKGRPTAAIASGNFHQRWYLAHRTPPVYYPRAVPASHPMGGGHGAVVPHGPGGAAFFIPAHFGSPAIRQEYVAEALALQDPDAASAATQAARQPKPADLRGTAALKAGARRTAILPLKALAAMPYILGGAPPPPNLVGD